VTDRIRFLKKNGKLVLSGYPIEVQVVTTTTSLLTAQVTVLDGPDAGRRYAFQTALLARDKAIQLAREMDAREAALDKQVRREFPDK
jgi:hypothetical protein